MLTAIKIVTIVLNMVVNHYQYDNPTEFIEMTGYAINEELCKQAPKNDRIKHASCHSMCAAQRFWFSDDDIYDDFGSVCEELNITNETM